MSVPNSLYQVSPADAQWLNEFLETLNESGIKNGMDADVRKELDRLASQDPEHFYLFSKFLIHCRDMYVPQVVEEGGKKTSVMLAACGWQPEERYQPFALSSPVSARIQDFMGRILRRPAGVQYPGVTVANHMTVASEVLKNPSAYTIRALLIPNGIESGATQITEFPVADINAFTIPDGYSVPPPNSSPAPDGSLSVFQSLKGYQDNKAWFSYLTNPEAPDLGEKTWKIGPSNYIQKQMPNGVWVPFLAVRNSDMQCAPNVDNPDDPANYKGYVTFEMPQVPQAGEVVEYLLGKDVCKKGNLISIKTPSAQNIQDAIDLLEALINDPEGKDLAERYKNDPDKLAIAQVALEKMVRAYGNSPEKMKELKEGFAKLKDSWIKNNKEDWFQTWFAAGKPLGMDSPFVVIPFGFITIVSAALAMAAGHTILRTSDRWAAREGRKTAIMERAKAEEEKKADAKKDWYKELGATDFTEQAKEGVFKYTYAREDIIVRIATVLARNFDKEGNPIKNSSLKTAVMLIGPPGVGKTAIVEALALWLQQHPEHPLHKKIVRKIQAAKFDAYADGKAGKGQSAIFGMVNQGRNKVVNFLDETKEIIVAGTHSERNEGYYKELLAEMDRGGFMMIGATTYAEYMEYLQTSKLEAFMRRFELIFLTPPTAEEMKEILRLQVLSNRELRKVEVDPRAAEEAVRASASYAYGQPAAAVDLITSAVDKVLEQRSRIENIGNLKPGELHYTTVTPELILQIAADKKSNRNSSTVNAIKELLRSLVGDDLELKYTDDSFASKSGLSAYFYKLRLKGLERLIRILKSPEGMSEKGLQKLIIQVQAILTDGVANTEAAAEIADDTAEEAKGFPNIAEIFVERYKSVIESDISPDRATEVLKQFQGLAPLEAETRQAIQNTVDWIKEQIKTVPAGMMSDSVRDMLTKEGLRLEALLKPQSPTPPTDGPGGSGKRRTRIVEAVPAAEAPPVSDPGAGQGTGGNAALLTDKTLQSLNINPDVIRQARPGTLAQVLEFQLHLNNRADLAEELKALREYAQTNPEYRAHLDELSLRYLERHGQKSQFAKEIGHGERVGVFLNDWIRDRRTEHAAQQREAAQTARMARAAREARSPHRSERSEEMKGLREVVGGRK